MKEPSIKLDWGEPSLVQTRKGPRQVMKAKPSSKFWTKWKKDKEGMKKEGYSVTKEGDEWFATFWFESHVKIITEEVREEIETEKDISSAPKFYSEEYLLSYATETDFYPPVPEGLALFGYQRAAVEYITKRTGTLVAEVPGAGKSIITSASINEYERQGKPMKHILVVCPNTMKYTWKEELTTWMTTERSIGIVDRKDYPEDTEVVIINYAMLSKHSKALYAKTWDLVVFDESHYLKNKDAKRTKAAYGAKGFQGIKANLKIALTGTPITGRPSDTFTTLKYMYPDIFNNWWDFVRHYEGAYRGRFGIEFRKPQNLDELNSRLRNICMVRHNKEDVMAGLPPKTRKFILLEPDAKTSKLINQETILASSLGNSRLEYYSEDEPDFYDLATVRKELGLSKIKYVKEFIDEIVDNGDKVIVFGYHKAFIAAVEEMYPDVSVTITGATKAEDRYNYVKRFQTDPNCMVFFGNLNAAGIGITLTAAHYVLFFEVSWLASELEQAENRAFRKTQEYPVIVKYILYRDSLDARMINSAAFKQNTADTSLEATS